MQMQDEDGAQSLPTPEKITANIMEGTVGERGELYVGLQFFLVFMVIIAPAFQDSIEAAGLFAGMSFQCHFTGHPLTANMLAQTRINDLFHPLSTPPCRSCHQQRWPDAGIRRCAPARRQPLSMAKADW